MKTLFAVLAPCVIFACAHNRPAARINPKEAQRFEVSVQPRLANQCGVSTDFSSKAKTLDKLAECLIRGEMAGQGIIVAGATDPRGRATYDKQVGQTRADTVVSYLESKGVPSNKITTVSRGETTAEGANEQTYADDHKVEIDLVN